MPTTSQNDEARYRVTFVERDGQVSLTVMIFAPDDAEAKRTAKRMVDGHGIDLWDGMRFIEHYPPKTESDA